MSDSLSIWAVGDLDRVVWHGMVWCACACVDGWMDVCVCVCLFVFVFVCVNVRAHAPFVCSRIKLQGLGAGFRHKLRGCCAGPQTEWK